MDNAQMTETVSAELSLGAPVGGGNASTTLRSIDVAAMVGKAIADNDRRRFNFIISGIPEVDAEVTSDSSTISELLFAELDIDISHNILGTRRIGKPGPNSYKRVLITLNAYSVVDDILPR